GVPSGRPAARGGVSGLGGGIYLRSTALYGVVTPISLTMQDCTISGNRAIGTDNKTVGGGGGGSGLGGGLDVGLGCSASLTNATLSSNTAQGGQGRGWYYSGGA